MEFRGNIIFSVIVHVSVVMMVLALAGRNTGLSRLPENYIEVSLLEDTNERKSLPVGEQTLKDRANSEKRKMKSQVPPSSASDESINPYEKALTPQNPKDAQLSEDALKQVQESDTNSGGTHLKAQEKSLSTGDKTAGLGRDPSNHPSFAPSTPKIAGPSNGMEVSLTTGPHPVAGGTNSSSLIDQINAAIGRAKRYPVLARERGQEGSVVTEFSINAKGRPENIRITKSSGFKLLDEAAKDSVIRAAPFPLVSMPVKVHIIFNIDVNRSGSIETR